MDPCVECGMGVTWYNGTSNNESGSVKITFVFLRDLFWLNPPYQKHQIWNMEKTTNGLYGEMARIQLANLGCNWYFTGSIRMCAYTLWNCHYCNDKFSNSNPVEQPIWNHHGVRTTFHFQTHCPSSMWLWILLPRHVSCGGNIPRFRKGQAILHDHPGRSGATGRLRTSTYNTHKSMQNMHHWTRYDNEHMYAYV